MRAIAQRALLMGGQWLDGISHTADSISDSESLVRGAPRAREIHLIRKIDKTYEHALQSSWSLPSGRGTMHIVWQHYGTEQGTL